MQNEEKAVAVRGVGCAENSAGKEWKEYVLTLGAFIHLVAQVDGWQWWGWGGKGAALKFKGQGEFDALLGGS